MSLFCDYKTPGNVDPEKSIEIFSKYNFKGNRVLDIGCNYGLYCLIGKVCGTECLR